MTSGGVLIVCEANVCRSVVAQFVFIEQLRAHRGFESMAVRSRGVNAEPGLAACRLAEGLRSTEDWERQAASHRATRLEETDVRDASLVLTASGSVRAAVTALVPEARRRVFTLREAVWLSDGYAPSDGLAGEAALDSYVAHLDDRRGLQPMPAQRRRLWHRTTDPLDVLDGHLIGTRAHATTIRDVESLSRQIVIGMTRSGVT